MAPMPATFGAPRVKPGRVSSARQQSVLGEGAQRAGVTELAERLHLDLADPLACEGEALSDFLEGEPGLAADAEPEPQDVALAVTQSRQRALHLGTQIA